MTFRIPLLVALLALAGLARADVVVLDSGGRIVGAAERRGDVVHVESMAGDTSVPASTVARIDTDHRAPVEEYREREAALRASPSLEGELDLAVWLLENRGRRFLPDHLAPALRQIAGIEDADRLLALATRYEAGLGDELAPVWKRLLVLDPDQELARRALGYRRLEGSWVTEEEWQAAQGNVLFEDRFIPREMRDMILEERQAKLRRRLRDLERREARLARREKEVEDDREENRRLGELLRRRGERQALRERDLDDRERRLVSRERILDGLVFCRSCRGYFVRGHICSGAWVYCPRCQGYFRSGHRCR